MTENKRARRRLNLSLPKHNTVHLSLSDCLFQGPLLDIFKSDGQIRTHLNCSSFGPRLCSRRNIIVRLRKALLVGVAGAGCLTVPPVPARPWICSMSEPGRRIKIHMIPGVHLGDKVPSRSERERRNLGNSLLKFRKRESADCLRSSGPTRITCVKSLRRTYPAFAMCCGSAKGLPQHIVEQSFRPECQDVVNFLAALK